MPYVKSCRGKFDSVDNFEDFLISEFSIDVEKFVIREKRDYSCNLCNEGELDFLVKFRANRNKNPKKIDISNLNGLIIPDEFDKDKLKFDDTNGDGKHFQSLDDEHHDYIPKDEAELRNVAQFIYNNDSQKVAFSSDELKLYLINSINSEWLTFYNNKAGTRWAKFLVGLMVEKLLSDYSMEFKKDDLVKRYTEHGSIFSDRLESIAKVRKFENAHKNQISQAFSKESFINNLI